MFSHAVACSRVDALVRARGSASPWESVALGRDFGNWAQASRLFVGGRLDGYATGLCARLAQERGGPVELHFVATCRDDRGAPPVDWVDTGRDFCSNPP
jgi:hypothetical protein